MSVGIFELWPVHVCAPEKLPGGAYRCQARRDGRERCRRAQADFAKHKETALVVGVCRQHHKALIGLGWRNWPL